jgi:hypothetical protein
MASTPLGLTGHPDRGPVLSEVEASRVFSYTGKIVDNHLKLKYFVHYDKVSDKIVTANI